MSTVTPPACAGALPIGRSGALLLAWSSIFKIDPSVLDGKGRTGRVATRESAALKRRMAVMPDSSSTSAMSSRRQAELLAGHDPVVVLEAASTVLADLEAERDGAVVNRLPRADQHGLARWRSRAAAAGDNPAPISVHPLALLSATTLALAQSTPGVRNDAVRERVAGALTRVALRLNTTILGSATSPVATLASVARSALWEAVVDEDWMIWSGELVGELSRDPDFAGVAAAFSAATGLSLEEWWYRGLGERSTRAVHGAGSYGGTDLVDPDVERAWQAMTGASVADAVEAARAAVLRDRPNDPPTVAQPYDLAWLATKPVVLTADGRRFQLWIGANNRCLLPAGIAQTITEYSGAPYLEVAAKVGRVAERLLTGAVNAVPLQSSETRIPEAAMPTGISKCDYLIESDGVLVGFEFTLATPSRALSAGGEDAVRALICKLADKAQQIYSTFSWWDRRHRLRRLPVLVLVSPTMVDPLLNERVHDLLVERGVVDGGRSSELMTCHVPHFLDLLQHATERHVSPADLVLAWRDSDFSGTALQWWLSDRNAYRSSGRHRIGPVTDRAAAILTRNAS